MPHETRRSAREAAAAASSEERLSDSQPSQQKRKLVRRLLLAVLALLLVMAVWLVVKVFVAKDSLEAAQEAVRSLQGGGDTREAVQKLADNAATASGATADPIWMAAEFLPAVGDNLRGVRLAAETLDVMANDVAVPVLSDSGGGESGLLARALTALESAAPRISELSGDVRAISASPSLIGPVRSGLGQVSEVMELAEPVFDVLPQLLGGEGERNYLLVFQNNAEALPLGGSSASQTLITAHDGALEISAQANSGSFVEGQFVDLEIPASAKALYGDRYGSYINLAPSQPDWPGVARMIEAFWNRDIDDTRIDGVISVDPVALERMLLATGPIEVDGVSLDESNAVKILLSDVYEWWDPYKDPDMKSDKFFAGVADAVFGRIASGDFDIKDMVWAVSESIESGSVMAWLRDPEAQRVVEASGRLSGVLPADNSPSTVAGVYFRNVSASKIDYYLDTAVDATLTCANGVAELTATATLTLDITQAEADALPRYVQSRRMKGEVFGSQVFMYAPPGMEVVSTETSGDASPFRQGHVDLGRQVSPFQMRLVPGGSATVTTTFRGDGDFGDLDVWTTPMIRATEVSLSDTCG